MEISLEIFTNSRDKSILGILCNFSCISRVVELFLKRYSVRNIINNLMSLFLFSGCIVNSILFPRWDAENLCRQFKTKYTVQDNPAVYYRYCRLCSYWSTGKIWSGKRKSQGLLYCSCKLLKHNLLTFHIWLGFVPRSSFQTK